MAHRDRQTRLVAAALAGMVFVSLVLIAGSTFFQCSPGRPSLPDHSAAVSLDSAHPATIRIATFNIQNLGKAKLKNAPVMGKLAEIVRQYDLVAVQEVSDVSGKVPTEFLKRINETGRHYLLALSERTGKQPDDKTSQEQYAFYYDDSKIEKLDERLFDDSEHDLFQREPYMAHFRVKNGRFTFVLITIHTQPKLLPEIAALHDVVQWARRQYPSEDDFIVLGDFNAGKSYARPSQLGGLELRGPGYTWVVPDDADTNVAAKQEAHDRIVITPGTREDFTGRWGVDNCFTDSGISDHWPVWAEFYTHRDTNGN